MKLSTVVGIALAALSLALPSQIYAVDCDTNCKKRCYKKTKIGKFDDPVCRAQCEANKRLACITGREIPTLIPTPGEVIQFGTNLPYEICAKPFEGIVAFTRGRCKNFDDRMVDRQRIADAIDMLVAARLFTRNEFAGVRIRWCPLQNAHGMAPHSGEIYLDTDFLDGDMELLASLLAHEMQHVRQWRRHGRDEFPCKYSEAYVGCSGCQDNGNRFEREAYGIEEEVLRRLSLPAQRCETRAGTCQAEDDALVGDICSCTEEDSRGRFIREHAGRAVQ